MNRIAYKNLIIEVFDERSFNVDSADNKFQYSKIYFGDGGEGDKGKRYRPASMHGIKILSDEIEINNCLLVGFGPPLTILQGASASLFISLLEYTGL